MENRIDSPKSKPKWPVDGRISKATKKSFAWPSVSTVLSEAKVNKIQPITGVKPNATGKYTATRELPVLNERSQDDTSIQTMSDSISEDRSESVMKMENENEQPESYKPSNETKSKPTTEEPTKVSNASPAKGLGKKVVNIPIWALVLIGVVIVLLLVAIALILGLVLGLRRPEETKKVIDIITTNPATQSTADTSDSSSVPASSSSSITTRQAGTCAYAGVFDAATNKCNCMNGFSGDLCETLPDCSTLPKDPIECAQLLSFVEISTLTDQKLIGFCPKSTICLTQSTTTTETSTATTTTDSTTTPVPTTTITTFKPLDCLNGGIYDPGTNKCNCVTYWSGVNCEIKPDCATLPNDPAECTQLIADLNGQPADDLTKAFCPKYFLCP